jgi:hypothetical protein
MSRDDHLETHALMAKSLKYWMLKMSYAVKKGGKVALNINDVRGLPHYVEDLESYCIGELGYKRHKMMGYAKASFYNNKKRLIAQPIFVFEVDKKPKSLPRFDDYMNAA